MKISIAAWCRIFLAAFALTMTSARAAEYGCSQVTAGLLSGKTLWTYLEFLHEPYTNRGYVKFTLNANGTYSATATNTAFNVSGNWSAWDSNYLATAGGAWVEIHLNNIPANGNTCRIALFNFGDVTTCNQYTMEDYTTPTSVFNIQDGSYRVTDGETPTPLPPTIVTSSGGGTITLHGTAAFYVYATGTPPLHYQWRKDGTPVPGATAANYSITNVQFSDAATYSVIVSNSVTSVTSTGLVLTVVNGTAPAISQQPYVQGVASNSFQTWLLNSNNNANLSASATGTPTLYYQWRFNNAPITDATNSYFFISGFNTANVGAYDVVVTNNFGSVTSIVANLGLNSAPIITQQPTNFLQILANSNFSLSVTAIGTPPLTYAWRKGGVAITGATNAVYNGKDTNYNAYGDYTVKILNAAGAVTSSVAHVDVYGANQPYFTVPVRSNNVVLPQGTNYPLYAEAYSPPPVTFTWRKDGTNIPGLIGLSAAGFTNSDFYQTGILTNLMLADSGTYTIIASNSFGFSTSPPVVITVDAPLPPLITQHPTNATLYLEPGYYVLAVEKIAYVSVASVTTRWFTNNIADPYASSSIYNPTVLGIGPISVYATVSNQYGVSTSAVATVNVLQRPGSADTNFAAPNCINSDVLALAPQTDGKLVIGGSFSALGTTNRNYMARLLTNGWADTNWLAASNKLNGIVNAIAQQPDGSFLIGGNFTGLSNGPTPRIYGRLARLFANGTLDTNFLAGWSNSVTYLNNTVNAIALRSDGSFLVGGLFSTVGSNAVNGLALFDSNGVFQSTFTPRFTNNLFTFNVAINAMALQPDGKILVGGLFTNCNGVVRNSLARLNADGTLDGAFNPNPSNGSQTFAIVQDNFGGVLIGGNYFTVGGYTRYGLVRLTNGLVDTNFSGDLPSGGIIYSLARQTGGHIIVGGNFTAGPSDKRYLYRVLPSGKVDADFSGLASQSGGPGSVVKTVAVGPDGGIWIGGSFNGFPGYSSCKVAKLYLPLDSSAAPQIGAPFFSAGQFGFTLPTLSGRTYQIHYSPSLNGAWQPLQNFTGDGAIRQITAGTNGSAGFYRIGIVP